MSKKYDDTCEIFCFDEEKVNRLKPSVNTDKISQMGKMFKVLADDTRIKIAYALCQEDELCVCDVANIVGSTMATASHHLRLLRDMGLAKYRKEGKLVFYSLEDEHIKQLIMVALTHLEEEKNNG
jgi:ArsR family transcriptional regulator, lead/cadmium/zinc/bismuth-responsive transcriptional repressor